MPACFADNPGEWDLRTASQLCLADVLVDKTKAAHGSSRVSRWKTHGCVSKRTGRAGFEISHWIIRRGGRRHLVEDASRAYSVYHLRPQMASWTSVGLDRLGCLAGAKEYARIASLITSMPAGYDGSFSGWNWASRLSTRALAFLESKRASPPV